MGTRDSDLDRLLRAAQTADEQPASAPFGFNTRVVALWRAQRKEASPFAIEFARLVRRIAVGAVVLIAFASLGAYWQLSENEADDEPLTNAYAIADTAIDSGLIQ